MKNYDVSKPENQFIAVQLYDRRYTSPWLIGADPSKDIDQIVEETLKRRNLIILWENTEGTRIPAKYSPGVYRIPGMSLCEIREGTHHFLEQPGYTGIDEDHLKAFQRLNQEFKYEIHREALPQFGPRRIPTIDAQ